MGNHQSSGNNGSSRPAFQRPYALGLSRSDLDARCKPSGLYKTCQWEERAIRRLIGDGKAASRLRGKEVRTDDCFHECPICFLYYSQVNVTKCCNANICTECFLQVRPQKEKHPSCPFCNHNKFSISVQSAVTEQERLDMEKEEEAAHEARMRCDRTRKPSEDAADGFGSSLEKDERVQKFRARSESIASSEHSGEVASDTQMIQSLAMTPEERARLEAEMRNQNLHPLSLQVQAEAEQRRNSNDRAYHRDRLGQYGASSLRGRRYRDWNSIVEAYESSGNGAVHSLDDLVVLEAAILLSMEEESRRGEGDNPNGDFDAASHARQGFPLVRSFLANRGRPGEGSTSQMMQLLHGMSHGSDRGRRHQDPRSVAAHLSTATSPASSLLLRGMSEEEQIAMAIAASMQDQAAASSSTEEINNENDQAEDSEDDDGDTADEEAGSWLPGFDDENSGDTFTIGLTGATGTWNPSASDNTSARAREQNFIVDRLPLCTMQ
mmetsp:Transcript_86174/g.248851  ORF Transcript_86174/g.248851 Transcript_86174/m.248851 type:complete len:494 (-) Transcript_86174:150-1631(-)